jgi:hypothetical protein
MAQKKETKKNLKVRDLKPKKDAKGGGRNYQGPRASGGGHQYDGPRQQRPGINN